MSKKLVVIDLSNEFEIRIINVEVSKRVKIISGFLINYMESDNLYELISNRLVREGIIDLPAIVFPPRKLINKFLYTTPIIPEREIFKIVKRRLLKEKNIKEDIFINILKNGELFESNLKRLEILSLYSSKSFLESMLDSFKAYDIKVVRLYDEIQLMKIFMSNLKSSKDKKKANVLVEVVNGKININIFREEFWTFNREFVFKFDDSELNDDDFNRISVEINRTFQFFKQKYRMYSIEKVIIFGTDKRSEKIKEVLVDITGLNVNMMYELLNLKNYTLPSSVENREEFFNAFGLTLLAAEHFKNKNLKNILPVEYIEKGHFFQRIVGLSVSAAIIIFIMATFIFYMEGLKSDYKKQIKKLNDSYMNLSNDVAMIESIKKKRADYFVKTTFLNLPVKHSYVISDFIRKLSLISSDEVELIDLDMKLNGINLDFVLKGIIRSENNIRAQTVFLKFFNSLKEFENLSNVNSSNLNVSSNESGSSADIRTQNRNLEGSTKNVEMVFTISGMIEVE